MTISSLQASLTAYQTGEFFSGLLLLMWCASPLVFGFAIWTGATLVANRKSRLSWLNGTQTTEQPKSIPSLVTSRTLPRLAATAKISAVVILCAATGAAGYLVGLHDASTLVHAEQAEQNLKHAVTGPPNPEWVEGNKEK